MVNDMNGSCSHRIGINDNNSIAMTFHHDPSLGLPVPTISSTIDKPPPYKAGVVLGYDNKNPR